MWPAPVVAVVAAAVVVVAIGSRLVRRHTAAMVLPAPSDGYATEELLDVVEPDGSYVTTLPRSVVHAEGLWHQTFHCLVVRSAPPARVLLQRRKSAARAFPALLDISAAGHLSAGESPLDGVREVREEIGLIVDPARLVSLGRRLLVDDGGEGRNREVTHVFLLTDDTPLADLRLDPAEVDGFVEMTVAELGRLLTDPAASVTVTEVDTGGTTRETACTLADLVPAVDSYWRVLVVMADRFVAGLEPLGI